jgi:hypothetical protein
VSIEPGDAVDRGRVVVDIDVTDDVAARRGSRRPGRGADEEGGEGAAERHEARETMHGRSPGSWGSKRVATQEATLARIGDMFVTFA